MDRNSFLSSILISERAAELGSFHRGRGLDAGRAGDPCHAGGFLACTAVLLRGLLVIAVPLDIADEALFFAHLLACSQIQTTKL